MTAYESARSLLANGRRFMPKVLVVDDSATMRTLLAIHLRRVHGVTMLQASDGQEALETTLVERPDLIITDMDMPRMGGCELVESLRRDPANDGTRIVMITTAGKQAAAERAVQLGADACLMKPVVADELVSIVQSLLGEGTSDHSGDT